MGRPRTELTPERRRAIVEATKRGLTREVAAQAAGVSRTTLQEWLASARNGDPNFADFAHEIKEAEAQGEDELVSLIRSHARDTWQAAAWLLERRKWKRYGLKQKVTHQIAPLTEDQALAKYRELTGRDYTEDKA